VDRCAR